MHGTCIELFWWAISKYNTGAAVPPQAASSASSENAGAAIVNARFIVVSFLFIVII